MAVIRVTETEKKDFDILPIGYYEVFVEAYDAPEAVGEIEKSSFTLVVRDDIEQPYAKRKMWVNISTNPNIAWKLSNIARAARIPAGTDFESLADYLAAIKGASMKVKVDHREYNGKTYADVKAFYATREKDYELPLDLDKDTDGFDII